MDDEKLHGLIDFNRFEEIFAVSDKPLSELPADAAVLKPLRKEIPKLDTLLDAKRLRNLAISKKRINLPNDRLCSAINTLDGNSLNPEYVDILLRFIPTDEDKKKYKDYVDKDKKNPDGLTEEDKLMLALTRVERLSQKLSVMQYMANFEDSMKLLEPQLNALIVASANIQRSERLKELLEIILCFGNYMNAGRRGPAYGFKVKESLEILFDPKSKDKKMTLMHYVVETVEKNFPHLLEFHKDLDYVEKAASVTVENLDLDVKELQKGMELLEKESKLRKDFPCAALDEFSKEARPRVDALAKNEKKAKDAFKAALQFFGERPTTTPKEFYDTYVVFIRNFKRAMEENQARRKAEEIALRRLQEQLENQQVKEEAGAGLTSQSSAFHQSVMDEMNDRLKYRDRKVAVAQDGTLDAVLDDLRKQPFLKPPKKRPTVNKKPVIPSTSTTEVLMFPS